MDAVQYRCAECPFKGKAKLCFSEEGKGLPSCPTRDGDISAAQIKAILEAGGDLEFFLTTLTLEKKGVVRIMEAVNFAKKMGYTRLGLAFCSSLSKEAKIIASLFEAHGFEIVSAICKVGRTCERDFSGKEDAAGGVLCNPVYQAQIMNEAGVDYNLVLGLCVGHDSLFMKYADAMSTVLAVKDRVLGHNPLAAVYTIDSFYSHLQKGK